MPPDFYGVTMARREIPSVFSTSLLDMLCCAFGAVIILSAIYSALLEAQSAIKHEGYIFVDARLSLEDPSCQDAKKIQDYLSEFYFSLIIDEPNGTRYRINYEAEDLQVGAKNNEANYQIATHASGDLPFLSGFITFTENSNEGPYLLELRIGGLDNPIKCKPFEDKRLKLEFYVRYPERDGLGKILKTIPKEESSGPKLTVAKLLEKLTDEDKSIMKEIITLRL